MNKINNLKYQVLSLLLCLSFSFSLDAQSEERNYIDYLPKYLKSNQEMLISRIDYFPRKMVIYLRFAVDKNGDLSFYGEEHPNAWVLKSGSRANKTIRKRGKIKNIRINNKLQINEVRSSNKNTYQAKRGDIVSCEIHTDKMPHFIKVVNVEGGDHQLNKNTTFLCKDLMLKTESSPMLGTVRQMETLIRNFNSKHSFIQHPEITFINALNEENTLSKEVKKSQNAMLVNQFKPMPKDLMSIKDLTCHEKLILRNVYFEENSAKFAKKAMAYKNINTILRFLQINQDAKIILYGHTDVFGDPYENINLSRKRVVAVKQALVKKGIDKKRILVRYHGGNQPLPGYEAGNDLNRRVEVEVICDSKLVIR